MCTLPEKKLLYISVGGTAVSQSCIIGLKNASRRWFGGSNYQYFWSTL